MKFHVWVSLIVCHMGCLINNLVALLTLGICDPGLDNLFYNWFLNIAENSFMEEPAKPPPMKPYVRVAFVALKNLRL